MARKTTSSTGNTSRKKPAGQDAKDVSTDEKADASKAASSASSSAASGKPTKAAPATTTQVTPSRRKTAGAASKQKAQSASAKSNQSKPSSSSTTEPETTDTKSADKDAKAAVKSSANTVNKSADVAVATSAESNVQYEMKRRETAKAEASASSKEAPKPAQARPATASPSQQVADNKGGFIPVFLGGVAAAVLGAAAAWYFLGQEDPQLGQLLQDQKARIDALSQEVEKLSQAPDTSDTGAALAELTAEVDALSDQISATDRQFADIQTRLNELEKQPLAESVSEAAIAAYENELKALQEAMATQRAEIEAMTAEARALEQSAQQTQEATAQRAAITRIRTALETGGGFAPAVAELQATGLEVPDALRKHAEDGVATLAELQTEFPAAARAALAASRRVAADAGESAGIGNFLRDQLGVRSLEPKEGDDPDAVLSRAEAAIREGRLQDALAEIDALPEEGRAELSDLSGKATRRIEAVAALQELSETLN